MTEPCTPGPDDRLEGELVHCDPAIAGESATGREAATERRQPEAQVAREWLCDPLTGLATRTLFVRYVREALERAKRSDWVTAVFALDIDALWRVNDELGHEAGDEVLVAVARRLEATMRPYDTVARPLGTVSRLAGDEFLLLCEDVGDARAAASIASRILAAVASPLHLSERELAVSASAGIALATAPVHAERLVLDAEAAMRKAKQAGGDQHEFFAEHLRAVTRALAEAERALLQALENEELRLAYQPKVSLSSDRIVGLEGLLRWHHPERGAIPPSEFIPLAEASGLIVPIGEWVLRRATRQIALWQQAFPRATPLQMAVNVSARQFAPGLVDTVRGAILDAGINPASLCLEVTESTVMDDVDAALDVLGELKALGVLISIDDFGTGYSSLAYLRQLPLDEIKIDKSFVDGLGMDPEDTAIVAAVISLAHALERDVVAEGVETPEQLERLRSLGCEFAQGYALARPLTAAGIQELLADDAAGERLPKATAAPQTPIISAADTILVVDDAADVRQLARMSLTAAGFSVEEAHNGAEALTLARRLRPDCVILDVNMPDMTGHEVCDALRAEPATSACTIVMLTARAHATDKVQAFSSGADDYIVKPFAPRDLVARVRSALRRQHIQ